jgi:coenzyme F420-0:L-glutamate ligase/coenzyme F420-1:gamma-L-glutamate ligase
LVTTHRLGFTSANSGIDQSNIEAGDTHALLLPVDPDRSAANLRDRIESLTGAMCGVIISDSHGRPFRVGNVGVAIGAAGVTTVLDLRGSEDLYGRPLRITLSAYGDLLASAAHLVCGEGADGFPVVLVRGIPLLGPFGTAQDLIRQPEYDLYR